VNPQQRIAIQNPCLLSMETMRPIHRCRSGSWTEVLTVNSGYE
jgi:hypothetical protein